MSLSSALTSLTTTTHITATFLPSPITTTFTPPPECTGHHLTMMEDMQFSIWLNEPLPVSNVTITSCYPSQFGNSWLLSAAGTTLPAFSPLVCPQDYTTALNGTNGYIACCPSGYLLNAPSTSISDRPAYGAQCYTPITVVTVTSYNNYSLVGPKVFSQSSGAQAFAYPIDGFAVTSESSATETQDSITTTASTSIQVPTSASTSTNPTDPSTSSSSHLSGGAIAGIVIGSLAFLLLFCTAILLFIRNHRRKAMLERSGLERAGYRSNAEELDATKPPVELSNCNRAHEMDGENYLVQDAQSFYRGSPDGKGEKSG